MTNDEWLNKLTEVSNYYSSSELAHYLMISISTIARWKNGQSSPAPAMKRYLISCFSNMIKKRKVR